MPLIEILALPQPPDVDVPAVTRALAREVAAAIPCRVEAVWTVWRTIDGVYAQGESIERAQPGTTHGPIVHVYLHRSIEETERAVTAIERNLSAALGLAPGNVFVTVQPVAWPQAEPTPG
jgi:hypothetical protein